MGGFSRKALELEEYKLERMNMEVEEPGREERLQQRLDELKQTLERQMELLRMADDSWGYSFHSYFYEDYIMHYQDDVSLFENEDGFYERYSVQGLLRSIREIEEKLSEIKEARNNSIKMVFSIFLTGATPDGQLALPGAFDLAAVSAA